jgi:hypothetical protein
MTFHLRRDGGDGPIPNDDADQPRSPLRGSLEDNLGEREIS